MLSLRGVLGSCAGRSITVPLKQGVVAAPQQVTYCPQAPWPEEQSLLKRKRLSTAKKRVGFIVYSPAAEPLLRESLEEMRKALSNRHQCTLTSIGSLGELLKDKGDLAAAEPLLRERCCIACLRRSAIGTNTRLPPLAPLASYCKPRALAAAEPLLHKALEGRHETLGSRHPHTLNSINNLGELLKDKGATSPPLSHCAASCCRCGARCSAAGIRATQGQVLTVTHNTL